MVKDDKGHACSTNEVIWSSSGAGLSGAYGAAVLCIITLGLLQSRNDLFVSGCAASLLVLGACAKGGAACCSGASEPSAASGNQGKSAEYESSKQERASHESILWFVLSQTHAMLLAGSAAILLLFGFGTLDGVHLAGQALLGAIVGCSTGPLLATILVDSTNGIAVRWFTRRVRNGSRDILAGKFFYAIHPSVRPYLVATSAIAGAFAGLWVVKETAMAAADAQGADVWAPSGMGEGGYLMGDGEQEQRPLVETWSRAAEQMRTQPGGAQVAPGGSGSGGGAGAGEEALEVLDAGLAVSMHCAAIGACVGMCAWLVLLCFFREDRLLASRGQGLPRRVKIVTSGHGSSGGSGSSGKTSGAGGGLESDGKPLLHVDGEDADEEDDLLAVTDEDLQGWSYGGEHQQQEQIQHQHQHQHRQQLGGSSGADRDAKSGSTNEENAQIHRRWTRNGADGQQDQRQVESGGGGSAPMQQTPVHSDVNGAGAADAGASALQPQLLQ